MNPAAASNAQIHTLLAGPSRFTVTVQETPQVVNFIWRLEGPPLSLEQVPLVEQWALPILARYDSDPRPCYVRNAFTGEQAMIFGDGRNAVGLVVAKN